MTIEIGPVKRNRKEYLKHYAEKNKEKLRIYNQIRHQKNRARDKELEDIRRARFLSDWNNYFKEKYGEIPFCEICKKELTWEIDKGHKNNRLKSVFFDHKHNNIPIKYPKPWCGSHSCNEKNREIWNKCFFGLLCGNCNIKLPTENRTEWLKKAIKYVDRIEYA